MEIRRGNKTFKLTKDELFKAYMEQEHLFDIQNIEDNLENYFADDIRDSYERVRDDKEVIEKASYKLRKLMDNGCSYDYSLETAIRETVIESNNRILQVMDDYHKHDIVMSELLRNYSELTISEKNALLEWSGDSEFISTTD